MKRGEFILKEFEEFSVALKQSKCFLTFLDFNKILQLTYLSSQSDAFKHRMGHHCNK